MSEDAQAAPIMCANGCGFYGSPMNENMCSKCYRESKKQENKPEQPEETAAPQMAYCANGCPFFGTPDYDNLCSKCWNEKKKSNTSLDEPLPSLPRAKTPEPAKEDAPTDVPSSPGDAQTNKSRCYECRKKIGLTGFQCKCGFFFCSQHRYSEDHNCQFDWKTHGREKLEKTTTKCVGKKLERI